MIEILKFKPYENGTLRGFATVLVTKWKVEIHGITYHTDGEKTWILLPSREYTTPEGETRYRHIMRFQQKEHYYAFINAVKEAVEKYLGEQEENNEPERSF